MPKAIVDPEELRRFAFELKRFSGDMRERVSSIHHHFVKLGETWQDQEHAKFADEFEQVIRSMAQFAESSEKHIPFLLRKAESIQAYLDQR
jgi:uncharacterized protein YukE